MENQPETCKNCENQFEKTFKFCPHCGQQSKEDLTVGLLFYNTISNYFSFDARFFKSFLPLLFKPGYLSEKFIEGKRLMYLHPAQLYLFVSVVFFFLLSITVVRKQVQDFDTALKKTFEKPLVSDSTKIKAQQVLDSVNLDDILLPLKKEGVLEMKEAEIKTLDSIIKNSVNNTKNINTTFDFDEKKVDSLIAIEASNKDIYKAMGMTDDASFIKKKYYEQSLKFYKQRNGGQILQAVYDTIPISLFILLPIFAFILKVLFYKRGSYSHHLVFSFYFFSFLFTVFSLILIANYFWSIPNWIDWGLVLFTFFYLLIAVKRFYRQGWFWSFFKTGLATFTYFTLVIPIAIVLLMLSSFLFY
ncbi:DUF3667 domain-containing protein [Flavivirga jejuensis]|uniref:DUF3667 domain-containing protein n=1 Tax=Flavivirga jejuensis TaxID=870487 RepID=A0ABT8WRN8_9FLAO|nr:DUF3667 domain-containing protein [Flavivirga jejuensis]MDO5975829.1 DUF3667 domain-containing protein [Flavivirga jejuensis]